MYYRILQVKSACEKEENVLIHQWKKISNFFNLKKRNNDTYSLKIMGAIGDWYDDYVYDGNTIDNDGCSSSCQKEQYFSCDNPIPPAVTPASNCYFTGDITVNVVRI